MCFWSLGGPLRESSVSLHVISWHILRLSKASILQLIREAGLDSRLRTTAVSNLVSPLKRTGNSHLYKDEGFSMFFS